jgi:hypothetical protein
MRVYYVNKYPQPNGDHEVHKDGCTFMPRHEHRLFLGSHDNCHDAVKESKKKHFNQSNGCFSCSYECHTT